MGYRSGQLQPASASRLCIFVVADIQNRRRWILRTGFAKLKAGVKQDAVEDRYKLCFPNSQCIISLRLLHVQEVRKESERKLRKRQRNILTALPNFRD